MLNEYRRLDAEYQSGRLTTHHHDCHVHRDCGSSERSLHFMSPSKSIPSWQAPIEFQAFRLIPGHEVPERAWAICSAQASPWNLPCRVLEWGIGELDRGLA